MDTNKKAKDYNYMEDLAIDPQNLAEEWLGQPGLYMRYAEALADAQKMRDKAKERLDVAKADLDGKIRRTPEAFGLSKITETIVSSTISLLLDEGYEEYNGLPSKLLESNYEVNLLQAAVKAFDHRKKALENLVMLYVAKWFAGPKEPQYLEPGKRIIDIGRDEQTQKQRKKINQRRRSKAGK